ncbi:phosphopantetheine-binding protein [Sphaerisporangium sp. NBC_01403]|uniref:phosphopantetheine-binding protein n=1 Tax=Sphaerisporangium sp. NBC_01403 TaxID=2903599 RepID=UPI003251A6C3
MTDMTDVTRGDSDAAAMRRRVAGMVAVASDGEISVEEVLRSGGSFTALGVTSLTTLRLLDAIEEELGVEIDLGGDVDFLDGLDSLAGHILGVLAARPVSG